MTILQRKKVILHLFPFGQLRQETILNIAQFREITLNRNSEIVLRTGFGAISRLLNEPVSPHVENGPEKSSFASPSAPSASGSNQCCFFLIISASLKIASEGVEHTFRLNPLTHLDHRPQTTDHRPQTRESRIRIFYFSGFSPRGPLFSKFSRLRRHIHCDFQ